LTEIWGVIAEEAARCSLLATSVQLITKSEQRITESICLADR